MKLHNLLSFVSLTMCTVLAGCAGNSPFSGQFTEKVLPTFQFEAWRDAPPSNPAGKSDAGLHVELGGRIVQGVKNGKGFVIVGEQLPLSKYPVYGPTDVAKRTGNYEFAFLFPGELDLQDLKSGNRFTVVGKTTGRRPVQVNGIPKTEPFLIADCIHVWPAESTENAGAASTLPEKTFCVAKS